MSRNSYTASERRGILAIAIIALILVGTGWGLSFCNRSARQDQAYPILEEHSAMVDSVRIEKEKKEKSSKKSKETSKKKTRKSFRQRSPLDEPV